MFELEFSVYHRNEVLVLSVNRVFGQGWVFEPSDELSTLNYKDLEALYSYSFQLHSRACKCP